MTEQLEFVNDWSELEAAVELLRTYDAGENRYAIDCYHDHLYEDAKSAIEILVEYVPRLLTQYANLVELSFALTEGWEQYVKVQAPTGLYLPDHR